MLDLTVLSYGIDTPHAPGNVVDFPIVRYWTVLCFTTPFLIRTVTGLERGEPGDCVITDPSFPTYHGPVTRDGEGFRNDWLHVDGSDMARLVNEYRTPLNRRIATGNSRFLTPWIEAIHQEQRMRGPLWEDAVAQCVATICLRISRQHIVNQQCARFSSTEQYHYPRFLHARETIFEQYACPWSVAEMAELVGLGPNRFTLLYQRFFGVSPLEDLIVWRITEACRQLVASPDTIEAIASRCGFASLQYFTRQFKRRIGCTPGNYRQSPHANTLPAVHTTAK